MVILDIFEVKTKSQPCLDFFDSLPERSIQNKAYIAIYFLKTKWKSNSVPFLGQTVIVLSSIWFVTDLTEAENGKVVLVVQAGSWLCRLSLCIERFVALFPAYYIAYC